VKYLLDTDHISFLQRKSSAEHTNLIERMAEHSSSDFAFSIISFHEQIIGAHAFINKCKKTTDVTRGYTLLLEILQGFSSAPVLPFDAEAVAIFDKVRAQKIPVGSMDLRIAAIALSQNLVLLTRNAKDFSRIPGLAIEDWTV
jgi:tRNA(fMet)-specific endonuclease VapC